MKWGLLVLALVAGCGDGGNGNGNFTGQCCINGAFYQCPNNAAFQKCVGFDSAMCHLGCNVADVLCNMRCDQMAQMASHDPSSCARNAAKDGSCTTMIASCMEQPSNQACTFSSDCPANNCTKGHCYGNANGNLCTLSSDCTSRNCTGGCCHGNALGDACTLSSDCTSGNCTGGHCQ